MSGFYLTADTIGEWTGGGLVTKHECAALEEFIGNLKFSVLHRPSLSADGPEPWKWDLAAAQQLPIDAKLCHIYSGTWPTVVKKLKDQGTKVVITIAAHDRKISQEEHINLGGTFPFTHLTDDALWSQYIEGYRQADAIVCPSTAAAKIVKDYGPEFRDKRIYIIPHGCELPETVKSPPKRFVCGYLGSFGADKGVRYLLEAWARLQYKDSLLILAGQSSATPEVASFVNHYGGGAVHLAGWQEKVSDFYNGISCLIQSSATEGFGLEVVEAMAHSRPVLCSVGAGAADVVPSNCRFPARDATALAQAIDNMKCSGYEYRVELGEANRKAAEMLTWEKIRWKYQDMWKMVLSENS